MSRSYVMAINTEVVRVLSMTASDIILFPRSRRGLDAVEAKFASRYSYPGIFGAVDESPLAIEHPAKFDGFYCRKCYPALSVQAIVNMENMFMSVEVRPGSWSDSKCLEAQCY
ncbi:hypothetical protein JG687_00016466 [Phytophthora cactorum]|uniref:DDE Tnp4 domain-containing protein n=1 Tax=Phytophthora cactorum TaxID=29920 RepID=A0A8T1TTQ6_9STRA|nr:hypothetical protein JG687_00016466 [Phytophthora cactorum]